MIKSLFFVSAIWISLLGEDIYATFDVVARKEANLNLSTHGIVKRLNVDVGSYVKKGSVLLEIDNEEQIASVDLAKERFKKAKIEEKFAHQTYERYKKVESVIDADMMDQHTLAYQKAASTSSEARASLRYQETLLEKTRLYAPFNGIIAERNIEQGDSTAGVSTLLRLISSPQVKLILTFDEKYLNQVKVGSKVRYRVDGQNLEKTGVIAKLYPAINPKNRKATAEVLTSHLAPGLFGEAYIVTTGQPKR
jgi:membrane fusion protein, multidrug efflux system